MTASPRRKPPATNPPARREGSVADYKRYVVPIIFLRFLSLRYDRRRAELETLVADKKRDYFGDKQAIHDPDEYRRVGAFVIPEGGDGKFSKGESSAGLPAGLVPWQPGPRVLCASGADEWLLRVLRNAFRQAHAGWVEVEIRYDNEEFRLRVRDNGRRIDAAVLANQGSDGHYGLRGMPEGAALIGGNGPCGMKSARGRRWSCAFLLASSTRHP